MFGGEIIMSDRRQSHRVALCGVLCALSVTFLLVGNALQIGTYAAPMLASLLLLPVGEEYSPKYALLLYLATALLAVFLVPDKELALFYALVMGYYPVLKKALDRLKPAVLRWAVKFAFFNAVTAAMYALLLALLASPALREEFAGMGVWVLAALLVMGNISFFFFDISLFLLRRVYYRRLRPRLKRYL